MYDVFFFFSSRRRHTRCGRDWSSDVCSSDLVASPFDDRLEQRIGGNERKVDGQVREHFLVLHRPLAFPQHRQDAREQRLLGQAGAGRVLSRLVVHRPTPPPPRPAVHHLPPPPPPPPLPPPPPHRRHPVLD